MFKTFLLFVFVTKLASCTILAKKIDLGKKLATREGIAHQNSHLLTSKSLSRGSSNLEEEIREKPLSTSRVLGQKILEKKGGEMNNVGTLQAAQKISEILQNWQSPGKLQRVLGGHNTPTGQLNDQAKKLQAVLSNKDVVFRLGIIDNNRQKEESCFGNWERREEGSVQTMVNAYHVVLEKYREPLSWELIGELRNELAAATQGTNFYKETEFQINDVSGEVTFGLGHLNKETEFPYIQNHRDEFNARFKKEICGKNTSPLVVRYCNTIKKESLKEDLEYHEKIKAFLDLYLPDFENPSSITSVDWEKDHIPSEEEIEKELKISLHNFLTDEYKFVFIPSIKMSLKKFVAGSAVLVAKIKSFDNAVKELKLEAFDQFLSEFEKDSFENFKKLDLPEFKELMKNQIVSLFQKTKFDENPSLAIKSSVYLEELDKQFQKLKIMYEVKDKTMSFINSPKIDRPELAKFGQELFDNGEYYPYKLIITTNKVSEPTLVSMVKSYLSGPKKRALVDALITNYNSKKNAGMRELAELISDIERIHPFNDFNARTFGALVLNKELLRMNQSPSIMFKVEDIDARTVEYVVEEIIKGQKFFEALTKTPFVFEDYPSNEAVFFGIGNVRSLLYVSENGKYTREMINTAPFSFLFPSLMVDVAKIDKNKPFITELMSVFYTKDEYFRNFINLSKKSPTENLMDNSYVIILKNKLIENVKKFHKITDQNQAVKQLEEDLRLSEN